MKYFFSWSGDGSVWSLMPVVAGQASICVSVCLNLVWEFHHSLLTSSCCYRSAMPSLRKHHYQSFLRNIPPFPLFFVVWEAQWQMDDDTHELFTVLAILSLSVWVIAL